MVGEKKVGKVINIGEEYGVVRFCFADEKTDFLLNLPFFYAIIQSNKKCIAAVFAV